MTIREMGQKLRQREVTCVQLLEDAHARIAELDDELNAFISVIDEPAGVRARLLDLELQRGADRGPLHGIPIAVKDNLATKGLRTTVGSRIFEDNIPDYDATVIEKLEAAGAVIVGKTNLHELAYGVTSTNPHYGAVRNPYNRECIPGGSSGGSGAAVAARIVPVALGTDTGGSIRIPAGYCGTVGLKPTYGRVSKFGCVPLGFTLDHIGPLAATVEDAAAVMNVIAGYDARDVSSSRRAREDYEGKPAAAGLRIGWPENCFFDHCDPEIRAACDRAAKAFENGGARIETVRVPDVGELNVIARVILMAEAAAALQAHMTQREKFGGDVLALLDQGRLLAAADYVNAQRLRTRMKRDFAALFATHDLLLTPTAPITAPRIGDATVNIDGVPEDVRLASTRLLRGINVLGLPALSLPLGLHSNGLPMSLQLVGRAFEERRLLDAGRFIESAIGTLPPP